MRDDPLGIAHCISPTTGWNNCVFAKKIVTARSVVYMYVIVKYMQHKYTIQCVQ